MANEDVVLGAIRVMAEAQRAKPISALALPISAFDEPCQARQSLESSKPLSDTLERSRSSSANQGAERRLRFPEELGSCCF